MDSIFSGFPLKGRAVINDQTREQSCEILETVNVIESRFGSVASERSWTQKEQAGKNCRRAAQESAHGSKYGKLSWK